MLSQRLLHAWSEWIIHRQQKWKQFQCTADEQLNKMCFVHTGKCHSSVKRKKSWHIIQHGWDMGSMICGGNQTPKAMQCMILHTWNVHTRHLHRTDEVSSCQWLEEWEGFLCEWWECARQWELPNTEDRILSRALQKSRFSISELFSNNDVIHKKDGILSLGSWGCNSIWLGPWLSSVPLSSSLNEDNDRNLWRGW